MFAAVLFIDTEEVDLVPTCWVEEDRCYWPPFTKPGLLNRAIRQNFSPEKGSWTLHSVQILGLYDSIDAGRKKIHATDDQMAGSQKRKDSIEDEEPSPSRKRQALFTGFHGSNYTSNSSGTIVIHPEMGMHPQMPSLIHPNVHNLAHSSAVNDDISASLSSLYMLSQQMIAAQSDTNVKIDSVLSSIQEKEILVIPQTDDPHNISPLDLNLPVHSIEELEVLERRILQKEFKSKLSLHISMIGGGTTKDVINRAMSFVLSHEVAVLFNWKGRSSWKTARSDSSSENKRAFSDLKLCQVIIKAVMTSALRSATAADIEVAMKMWLRNAPDRCGGRQRRALAKKLKETD